MSISGGRSIRASLQIEAIHPTGCNTCTKAKPVLFRALFQNRVYAAVLFIFFYNLHRIDIFSGTGEAFVKHVDFEGICHECFALAALQRSPLNKALV